MKILTSKLDGLPIWPLYLLLFTSADTVLFGTNGNRTFVLIPRLVSLLFILFATRFAKRASYSKNALPVCMALCTILTISILVNSVEMVTLMSRLLFIVTAYQIVTHYRLEEYIVAFDNFLYFISIVALGTFVVSYVAPSIFHLFYNFNNENNLAFSSFFVGSIEWIQINDSLKRMNAIFWEPGAYAIYLCIGIIYQLFFRDAVNRRRLIAYIAAIITTFSTTGIIGLAMIMLVYLAEMKGGNNNSIKALVILLMGGTFALFSLGYVDSIYEMFFSKITNFDPTTMVRYSSFVNGFQIAYDHPLFGVGGKCAEYLPMYASNSGFGENTMLTNTWVYQFANYGFIFGILFTIGTYRFFRRNLASSFQSVLLFVCILLLYVGECFYSFIPFLFVFYGFNKITNENSRH